MSRASTRTAGFFAFAVVAMATGCGRGPSAAEVQAACEGPPLRTAAARDKAVADGYRIDPRYDCIDKASYAAAAKARADQAAAKLSEGLARRREELAVEAARDEARCFT